MRKAGYFFKRKDPDSSELVFVRPPRGFPRFHLHLKEKNKAFLFSLHLDQKKPVYGYNRTGPTKGWQKLISRETGQKFSAHAGEYQGKLIEEEARRIEKALQETAERF